MDKYIKEFQIPYYDTDKNGVVYPGSLLTYIKNVTEIERIWMEREY